MTVIKTTSVLLVENISKEETLWATLGFKIVAEVPHGNAIGFAILSNDKCDIMLQTPSSLKEDLPAVAQHLKTQTHYLFNEVNDLNEVKKLFKESDVIVAERETFYGMKEIFVKTVSGNVIGFAQKMDT